MSRCGMLGVGLKNRLRSVLGPGLWLKSRKWSAQVNYLAGKRIAVSDMGINIVQAVHMYVR